MRCDFCLACIIMKASMVSSSNLEHFILTAHEYCTVSSASLIIVSIILQTLHYELTMQTLAGLTYLPEDREVF